MNDQNSNQSTRRRKRVPQKKPLVLLFMQWYFRIIGRLLPGVAAKKAYKLWFRTRRFNEPPRETQWLETAKLNMIKHEHGPLSVMQWGESDRTVILVHGWNGRGSQMGAFAAPLVEAGFRVVAYDLPAHGRSPGDNTNIFKAINTLETIAKLYGPVHAIVGHSFGGMLTALALKEGLQVKCVVCIAMPGSLQWLFDNFVRFLALPKTVLKILNQMINAEFGADIWDRLSVTDASRKLSTPVLIIHDELDSDVSWKEAEIITDFWQGAKFLKTSGLGHRRILRDPTIVRAVVDFISNKP